MIIVACCGTGPLVIETIRAAVMHPEIHVLSMINAPKEETQRWKEEVDRIGAGIELIPDSLDELSKIQPDIILHIAKSPSADTVDLISAYLQMGIPIISTYEELAFPSTVEGKEKINRLALEKNCAVLGIGGESGFFIGLLPALLTCPCLEISKITVKQNIDLASFVRGNDHAKRPEIYEIEGRKTINERGVKHAARLLAFTMGMRVDNLSIETTQMHDRQGNFMGYEQQAICTGLNGGHDTELRIWISACFGQPETEHITIDGIPPLNIKISGNVFGNRAFAAVLINAIPLVLHAKPGLYTLLDIPPIRAWKPRFG